MNRGAVLNLRWAVAITVRNVSNREGESIAKLKRFNGMRWGNQIRVEG
jgi:hypothetical protein